MINWCRKSEHESLYCKNKILLKLDSICAENESSYVTNSNFLSSKVGSSLTVSFLPSFPLQGIFAFFLVHQTAARAPAKRGNHLCFKAPPDVRN